MKTKEELVELIANGQAVLLSVNEICERLGISRSTFTRMKDFPKPTLVVGTWKRWEISSLKSWLHQRSRYAR